MRYVLTSNPKRVSYVSLTPTDEDLQQIQDQGIKLKLLSQRIPISKMVNRDFIPKEIVPAPIGDVSPIKN